MFAVDVDGDGDTDVLSARRSGDDMRSLWYENDGSQNFTAHTITTEADPCPQCVCGRRGRGRRHRCGQRIGSDDDKIAWYENDGSQNFTAHTDQYHADGAHSVFAADMDNDGDLDVLSASINDDKIAWYEQLDRPGLWRLRRLPYPTRTSKMALVTRQLV